MHFSDIKVQLLEGKNNYSGRVEITRNGIIGTICNDGWDDKDAAVVCRMLGFRYTFSNDNIH